VHFIYEAADIIIRGAGGFSRGIKGAVRALTWTEGIMEVKG